MTDQERPEQFVGGTSEIEALFWIGTPEELRERRAYNERKRMLLQGPERYPGMHDDLRLSIEFSENLDGRYIPAEDYSAAAARLIACGAIKDWTNEKAREQEAPAVRGRVVSFVGHLLGWSRSE